MYLFSDFDGTLTSQGKIDQRFFEFLNLLQAQKLQLVVVSGRSLAWGQFLLTHFPIDYAIMEGGGVLVCRHEGRIGFDLLLEKNDLERLELITEKVITQFGEEIFSDDSLGRLSDRAIELQALSEEKLEEIKAFLSQCGAHMSQSNIHLNFWVGQVSKALGLKKLIEQYLNLEVEKLRKNSLYFGDSANDETAFEFFENSVGVSNIQSVLGQLKFRPKYVLSGQENEEIGGVIEFLKKYSTGAK